jgi:hypothetical protein
LSIENKAFSERRKMPDRRKGYIQKAMIGDHKVYLHIGDSTTPAPPAGGEEGGGMPELGGGSPPPPPSEPAGEAGPPIPESVKKDRFKLLTESNEDDFDEDEFLSFQKGNGSLGLIEEELNKLLGD